MELQHRQAGGRGRFTIYAKWLKVKFSVGGAVTGNDGKAVEGAVVKLMQGSQRFDEGETDASGNFTFRTTISPGAYNIVTTHSGQTKTTLIAIESSDMLNVSVQLPPEGVSSELEVKPNTPAVVVGGLDDEAEALKTGSVSTVTVRMTVEGKTEAQVGTTVSDAIKNQATNGSDTSEPVVEYLDVSITKQVDDAAETVTSTTKVIEIVVPFDFSGKKDVAVLRYHNGTAEKLNAASTKADGTYSKYSDNGLPNMKDIGC